MRWHLPPPPRARVKHLSLSPWTAGNFDSEAADELPDEQVPEARTLSRDSCVERLADEEPPVKEDASADESRYKLVDPGGTSAAGVVEL